MRIIDKLRDVSSSVVERPADTERVQQLLVENSNLKTALLMARREVEEQKDKVITLLESAPVKELAAAQSDLAAQEKENENLRQTIEQLKMSWRKKTASWQRKIKNRFGNFGDNENKERQPQGNHLRLFCFFAASSLMGAAPKQKRYAHF